MKNSTPSPQTAPVSGVKTAPPTPVRRFSIARLPLAGRPVVTIAAKVS